jgi:hypothetical protein
MSKVSQQQKPPVKAAPTPAAKNKNVVKGAGFIHVLPLKNKNSSNFVDINGLPLALRKDINWLYQYGITTGVDATHFAPNANVTRGQMAMFLRRLAGSPAYAGGANCGFVDIGGAYARSAVDICWLKSIGVTTGVDATHFAPNANVTRGQMAAFLHRLYNWAVRA